MLWTAPLLAGAAAAAAAAKPLAYASSSDLAYRLTQIDGPVAGAGSPGNQSTWALTVDDTASGCKQTVQGFGGAITDATVSVINALPANQRTSLLNTLFTAAGLNFNLLRHTVASSDLSADPAYTYDDNNNQTDVALAAFGLGARGNAMAALLKEIRSTYQPNATVIGTPWSPPGWMKLNKKLVGTTVQNNLNHSYVSSYADYFVKYLQAYAKAGAPIDAITIQNEPLNSRNGMPTMYVYADESGHLINDNIGPALARANLRPRILAYDHNLDVPSYPATVLALASKYVSSVAWHCYANPNNWTVMTEFHKNYTAKGVVVDQYMTECYTSPDTPWNQASAFTLGPLQNWGVGSVAWTLGSDETYGPHLSYADGPCTTCRGLFTVDTGKGTWRLQVDAFMLGQYSKFIPRGAKVLAGTGSYTYADGTGVQSVASRNPDGSTTVVIENKLKSDVYLTTSFKSGRKFSGKVLALSVVTWVIPKDA